ncbi:MAG: hypothetical protein KDK55_06675 [Chlamydiia bacterium]|nr:hypothetical protein [Chlamydiia bacterium]
MKKRLSIVLAVLTTGNAFALPIGNPAEASIYKNGIYWGYNDPCADLCDSFSFRLGFYGDYVFNRNLQISGAGIRGNGDAIRNTEIFTNASYMAVNFCDRVDLFGTLGASQLEINTNEISWVFNGHREGTLLTDTTFSWSIGGHASLYEWGCFTLGIEGQYFQFKPDLTHYINCDGSNEFTVNNQLKYDEWQVGLGLAYEYYVCDPKFSMIPYVGVKWSGCHLNTDNFRFTPTGSMEEFCISGLKNNKHWGWALGLTFSMCDLIGVTAEGRFADEKAFHIRGQMRF